MEEPDTEQIYKRQSSIDIGASSIIGTRGVQQDTIFENASGSWAIAVVCDGIGGLANGEIASRVAVQSLVDAWFAYADLTDIPNFFREAAVKADKKIFLQTDENGGQIRSGTTIVAVIVTNNELYWLSIGDSKIYIIRKDEIMALNIAHNYRLELDMLVRRGKITPEEYEAEEYRADALISYLGMGNVSLMDINQQAFLLEDGDIVLLSSDGLYKSLQEQDIWNIIKENLQNMQDAAYALTAVAGCRKKQDNTSVVILRYRSGKPEEEKNDLKTM